MSLSEKLVSSNDVGEFTETIDFSVLSCGNVQSNNNKYYILELQKSPQSNMYRLFCTRGRIGSTTIYGVRGPIHDYDHIKKEYEKIVLSKTKGKSGGEVSKYTKVETLKPTIGSTNICNKVGPINIKVQKSDLLTRIKDCFSSEVYQIVKQAYDENIHQIQSVTTINVTDNGLETALGPVTPDHVKHARCILNDLKMLQRRNLLNFSNTETLRLNNQYISMIPRRIEGRIKEADMILTDQKLLQEYDLLDQLESAVQINTISSTDNDSKCHFGFCMTRNKDKIKPMSEWFEKSRASNHSQLSRWKVVDVFDVENEQDASRFDSCKIGGKTEVLWHGTRNCNLLSILMNGLIIPNYNAAHVTGRMFGNGIYGASNSTKSLNYSVGYWSGTKNKNPNAFLFVVKFIMGKTYYPTSSMGGGPPKGYDSIHAKKTKTGLLNDEYIVYTLPQQRITQLVELKQK